MFPYAMIGFAAGQQRKMLLSPGAEALANLACSLALVRILGARGVAIGTLIGAIVGVWLHLKVSLNNTSCIQVNRSILIWKGILKPVGYTLPFMLCALLGPWFSSPLLRVTLVAAAEVALFTLLWNFSFDSRERKQFAGVLQHFASILRRLRPSWSTN